MLLYDDTNWTTKDGRIIPIVDMEDRHLRNTIALLERSAKALQMQHVLHWIATGPDLSEASDGVFNCLYGEEERMMSLPPMEWLSDMPAYKALVKEQDARAKVGF